MSLGDDGGYGGDYDGHDDGRTRGTASGGHLTRTRLPEGDEDAVRPRPPRPGRAVKPSRNLITVVGRRRPAHRRHRLRQPRRAERRRRLVRRGLRRHQRRQPSPPPPPAPARSPARTARRASPRASRSRSRGRRARRRTTRWRWGPTDMFKRDQRHEHRAADLHARPSRPRSQTDLDKATPPTFLDKHRPGRERQGPRGHDLRLPHHPRGHQGRRSSASDTATVAVWCTGLFGLAGEGLQEPGHQRLVHA